CDTVTDGGGWIVIQRRSTGDVDFYRNWASYKAGFGTLDNDFWLGNDNIHTITSTGKYELRVDLKYKGKSKIARYGNNKFIIENEDDKYKLHVGTYKNGFAGLQKNFTGSKRFAIYSDDPCSNSLELLNKLDDRLESMEYKIDFSHNEFALRRNFVLPQKCKKNAFILYPFLTQYIVIYNNEYPGVDTPLLCDTVTDGGGWIVIQRRSTGDVDFYRNWASYKVGFGTLDKEFWLGNDNIHAITSTGKYELRVDLKYNGQSKFARYDMFVIDSEDDNYKLHVGSYSGTAGDSLNYHNSYPFSTFDKDNDGSTVVNCANLRTGAWWYRFCNHSNLNGKW
ncbi:hypothetical protein EGW08_019715, partial [Elysia chlorotica]